MLLATTIGRTVDAFLRPHVEELLERGHEVTILCADPAPVHDLERACDVVVAPWTRPTALTALPAAWWRTRRLLVSQRPDVVDVHTSVGAAIVRLAAATVRPRPLVAYCAHGFDGAAAQPAHRRIPARGVERALARVTDLLFVMNDEDDAWARRGSFRRVHRVPSIGIDLDCYHPVERTEPGSRLVVIAELIPRKRVHLAIEALSRLPERYEITIVGDGPQRPALEALAESLGCSRRTTFTGQLGDIRPRLAAAAALVSTSRQEGLPRSVLEAMAVGTPVVALAARGVSDVLADGAGVVVDGADPATLAAAVERLCGDPDEWSRQRHRGLAAAQRHAVGPVTSDMVTAIEALVAAR